MEPENVFAVSHRASTDSTPPRPTPERQRIDRELDLRACRDTLWLAMLSAQRAGLPPDFQAQLSAVWADCRARFVPDDLR
jgi:hypothetical protein